MKYCTTFSFRTTTQLSGRKCIDMSNIHTTEVFRYEILAACQPARQAKRPKCRCDSAFWIHEFRNKDHFKQIFVELILTPAIQK